jgi:hypothetical protein
MPSLIRFAVVILLTLPLSACLTPDDGSGDGSVACETGEFQGEAGCEACAACVDSEYTVAFCTSTTDTACASCTEPVDGEFVVTGCLPSADT